MSVSFFEEAHTRFISNLGKDKETFEYCVTEHLRMSGVYWGLTAMDLMGRRHEMPCDEIVEWVMKCGHPNGGFGGNISHDPHLLYTLSAIQILAILDELGRLDFDLVASYVAGLQQADGSFAGDMWGEVDTRFSYCAVSCLSILGRMDVIDVDKAMRYVESCRNFDGGFGCTPGAESHAGQVFCCVAALSIGQRLELCEADLLGWWLSERQCDSGGLNGRPEKQADVCYSWWILSALSILGKLSWIDRGALVRFILQCQDSEDGGVADRPDNCADVFHTFFGVAGLSLLGHFTPPPMESTGASDLVNRYANFKLIDPVYALPVDTVVRLGLTSQLLEAETGRYLSCGPIRARVHSLSLSALGK